MAKRINAMEIEVVIVRANSYQQYRHCGKMLRSKPEIIIEISDALNRDRTRRREI